MIETVTVAALVAAGILKALFIGFYHFNTTWWRSRIGKILMARSASFLLLIVAASISFATPDVDTAAETIFVLASATLLAIAMAVQLRVLVKEQRDGVAAAKLAAHDVAADRCVSERSPG